METTNILLSNLLWDALYEHNLPAIAAAVVQSDRIVASQVFGVRSVATQEPVTPADHFHIGSCTKSITAVLLMRLVEEEILSLDTPLEAALPHYKGSMHRAFQDVTVRRLLQHAAGLPAFRKPTLSQILLILGLRGTVVEKRAAFAEKILQRPPVAPPGSAWLYSNAGYVIAAHIAETRTGRSWEQLLKEKLFAPLALRSARFGLPAAQDEQQPRGHYRRKKWLLCGEPVLSPQSGQTRKKLAPFIAPAGDVHCSINDFARYVQEHLRGLRGQSGLLTAASYRQIHTPFRNNTMNYGLGWCIEIRSGRPISWHTGSAGTFYARMALAHDIDYGVVVATNAGHGEAACTAITSTLISKLASGYALWPQRLTLPVVSR